MSYTVSDAFRLMMMEIAAEKTLPFEPLVPNAETIEAMKAARRSELATAGSPDGLIASLNADDQVHDTIQAGLLASEGGSPWQDARRRQ